MATEPNIHGSEAEQVSQPNTTDYTAEHPYVSG